MDLLKRHKNGCNSRAITGVIRRAADAITNLAHENSRIKTRVRFAFFADFMRSKSKSVHVYISLMAHSGRKVVSLL